MMQISSIRNRRGIAQNFRGITMTKKQYFDQWMINSTSEMNKIVKSITNKMS